MSVFYNYFLAENTDKACILSIFALFFRGLIAIYLICAFNIYDIINIINHDSQGRTMELKLFNDIKVLKDGEISLVLERTAEANEEKGWVPAYYFAVCNKDGVKIGECDLRVGHNENTYYGGNVGYCIYEKYRGHHYAARACRLLFELAKKHGLDCLIISCDPDNYASRKTCEYAGGKLIETAELPADNDMRAIGDTHKCIYKFIL